MSTHKGVELTIELRLFAQTSPVMLKRAWSSKRLMESFHVCPLLFREKMETSSGVNPDHTRSKRPVYRYIFSCPGQAQALVRHLTLFILCYGNMVISGLVVSRGFFLVEIGSMRVYEYVFSSTTSFDTSRARSDGPDDRLSTHPSPTWLVWIVPRSR